MRKSLLTVLLWGTAACGGEDSAPPPALSEESREAARRACISTRISQQTEQELETLEEIGAPPLVVFTRALDQHAKLRVAAYAHQDSALRYARTPQDSARHAGIASRYRITAPDPGSVEENVIRDYERKFAAVYRDEDHPCNWEAELEARERRR